MLEGKYIPYIVALIVCVICAGTDIKTGKIKNYVVFPAMAFGLFFSLITKDGLFAQRIWVWILLFILGMFRLMGMGDIKLVMAVACLIQPMYALYIFLLGECLLIAFCFVTRPSDTVNMLKDTVRFLVYRIPIPRRSWKTYPFAVPFLAAFLFGTGYLLWHGGV